MEKTVDEVHFWGAGAFGWLLGKLVAVGRDVGCSSGPPHMDGEHVTDVDADVCRGAQSSETLPPQLAQPPHSSDKPHPAIVVH